MKRKWKQIRQGWRDGRQRPPAREWRSWLRRNELAATAAGLVLTWTAHRALRELRCGGRP